MRASHYQYANDYDSACEIAESLASQYRSYPFYVQKIKYDDCEVYRILGKPYPDDDYIFNFDVKKSVYTVYA